MDEGPVGAVTVVVVEVVVEEPAELAFVPDDGAVEELMAQGPHPAFGVGIGHRRLGWGRDRLDPGATLRRLHGVGSMPASRRIFHTLEAATS